ncbi:MAG: argininosuccinate lyase [Thermoplasmata archaeon]|nr:argininosuccinate lyase [Thermoplasmata archaeon]
MLRERFSRPLDVAALALSESTREDRSLLFHDLWGSIAHARMLGESGILPAPSVRRIVGGLLRIGAQAEAGRFPLRPSLEDVHLNVEEALTREIGEDGARLHTGRSRNDQVATDLLLYTREALLDLEEATDEVVAALLGQARSPSGKGVVTGWTHLQPAQRVYWAHILGSHALRFARDAERFARTRSSIRFCPLGSSALAGSSLPLDRIAAGHALGFEGPSPSSYDAVADRDAAVETLFDLSLLGVHASQLAEELVIGAMPEVGRVRLAEEFVTTSSLMPHKRNPDLAELVRAEAAPTLGRLVAHLALLKGLPLSYQRDLQAGKPLVVEGVPRGLAVLRVLAPMIRTAEFRSPPPSPGEATGSVELVDALVSSGMPFRAAHGEVALLVKEVESAGRSWRSVSPAEIAVRFPKLKGFSLPAPSEEPERRRTAGGSAWEEVQSMLAGVARDLAASRRAVRAERKRITATRRALGVPERWFPPGGPTATSRRSGGDGRRRSVVGSRRRPLRR